MSVTAQFQEEVQAAPRNRQVGTSVWFENERVKIWELRLAPGQRLPLHCHPIDYFWVCVEPGRVRQHNAAGQEDVHDVALGQVDFLNIASGQPLIHDIENVGDSQIRFVTVELK